MSISHECVWFGSRLTQKIGRQAGPGEEDQLLSLFLPLSLSLAWSKSPRTQWKPGQGTNAAICVLLFQRERGMRWVNLAPIYLFQPNNCQVFACKEEVTDEKESKKHTLEKERVTWVCGRVIGVTGIDGRRGRGRKEPVRAIDLLRTFTLCSSCCCHPSIHGFFSSHCVRWCLAPRKSWSEVKKKKRGHWPSHHRLGHL